LISNFFVNGIVLDDENIDLSFSIHNASGYTQPYIYSINDEIGLFDEVIDTKGGLLPNLMRRFCTTNRV